MPTTFEPVVGAVQVQLKAHYSTYPDTMIQTIKVGCVAEEPDISDCTAILAVVNGWIVSDFAAWLGSQWNIYALYAQSMAANPPPFAALPVDHDGGSGGVLAPHYAPEVLLHGPLAGRSYLGRAYCFAPASTYTSETNYSPTLMSGLVVAFENLASLLEAGGFALAVASKKLGTWSAVTSITPGPRLSIQKDRRVGFGG